MSTKTRKGLVEDKELYLSVSGVGYSKEELDEIIDQFDIDTPEGNKGAISALKNYMNSSEDDAVDVIGKLKLFGNRKGSCGHCERPENLSNISSSIVSGMNRKIGEPSRKGAPAFATGNSGKLMSDVKGFINNDTVSTKIQKTFGTTDQRNQAILKEHANEQAKIDRQNKVDQLRNGSRKGSIPRDILTTIENSVKVDGIEYDFTSTRNILESQGYNEFEIDEFVDEYMNNVVQ